MLFGAPGTLVTGNTIIGSPTDRGWGAINLVDSGAGYNGNFAGVVVTQNTITAGKMFNIGIAIGSNVWSDDAGGFKLTGPTSVTNNYFSGNIAFPIALNGWQNGITATGNTDSGVVKPNSDFAEDYSCSAGTATVFASNALWSYWSPGVSGSADLQGDFVDAAGGGEPTYYLCATPSLPNSVTFNAGSLTLGSSQGQFVRLHGGIVVQYQGDNNIVIGDISRPGTFNVLWASGHTVPSCTPSGQDLCQMAFQVCFLSRWLPCKHWHISLSFLRAEVHHSADSKSSRVTATWSRISMVKPNSAQRQILRGLSSCILIRRRGCKFWTQLGR